MALAGSMNVYRIIQHENKVAKRYYKAKNVFGSKLGKSIKTL